MANLENQETAISSTAQVNKLPLLIPEDISYNCQGCGRCCAGWSVGLTNSDYSKVKDVGWGALAPELANRELFTDKTKEFDQGLSQYPYYTKARADGSCPFLIDDLCFIHRTLGEDKKPANCRLFPYSFIPTPSGIYVGVVYSSMAAARNLGLPLSDQRGMLEHMWKVLVDQELALGKASQQVSSFASSVDAANISKIEYKVSLASDIPLTWSEYIQIEECLLEHTHSDRIKNIIDLWLGMSTILAEALRLKNEQQDLNQLKDFQPSVDRWHDESANLVEKWLLNLLCLRNFQLAEIRRLHPSIAVSSNIFSEPALIQQGFSTIFGGTLSLLDVGKINIERAFSTHVQPLSEEIDSFIRRYIYLKLFSKTFCGPSVSGLSVIAGYNNMVGNFISAIVFAKAHAMKRKEDAIAIRDLYEAFVLFEREAVNFSHLDATKASFCDVGLSSPWLFCRLLGQLYTSIVRK